MVSGFKKEKLFQRRWRWPFFCFWLKNYYLRAGRNLSSFCVSWYQKVLWCFMLWRRAVCFGPHKPSFPSHPAAQKYLLKYSTGGANAYLKMQVGARLENLSVLWSPFCLISCQWGGKGIQRQKDSLIVMALLWERNSDEILQNAQDGFCFYSGQQGCYWVSSWKAKLPCFFELAYCMTSSGKSRRAQTPLSLSCTHGPTGKEVGLHGHDSSQGPSPCGRRLMLTP